MNLWSQVLGVCKLYVLLFFLSASTYLLCSLEYMYQIQNLHQWTIKIMIILDKLTMTDLLIIILNFMERYCIYKSWLVLIFIGGPLFHPHSCISCWISEETRYVFIFMNMKKSIISILKSSKVFVFCDSYLTSSLLFSSVVKVCSLRCTLRNDSNMNVTHGRQIKIT